MKPLWLGDKRGALTDWATQQWVKATGRKVEIASVPWLDGPTGDIGGIGSDFFERWAIQNGLHVRKAGPL